MSQPKLSIASLGGTICMVKTDSSSGIIPKLNAHDLIAAIPNLSGIVDIECHRLFTIPSPHLTFQHILEALSWAEQQITQGSQGIILTQGTDTLEESAFLLDLLWKHEEPLILVGAMRSPEDIGADGLANLHAGIITAISHHSRGRGVMVVMNDMIHEARWVQKSHTTATNAFISSVGAVGCIHEGNCIYFRPPPKRLVFKMPQSISHNILLWQNSLSEDFSPLYRLIQEGFYHGIVFAGFGAGHLNQELSDLLKTLTIPVVVCSRTNHGNTAFHTYGWAGAEIDIQKNGAIMGGMLTPLKARLLLWVIINNQLSIDHYHSYLQTLSY